MIVDRKLRQVVFKPTDIRESGKMQIAFADLQIKRVIQTQCLEAHAQVLIESSSGSLQLITFMGDKRHRADEKIHSVTLLPDQNIRGFGSI